MKKLTVKKILIYSAILQLIMTGIFYLYSFKAKQADRQADYTTEHIEDSLRQIDMDYRVSQKIYKYKISALEIKLKETESHLEKEKVISAKAKNKVTELLSQNWDTLALETKSERCDTLREQVNYYIEQQDKKDSLYDTTLVQLEAINAEKTRQIRICDSSYVRMRNELEKSLLDSKLCNEKFRKQKKQNRILKVGAAVIAAFTIGYMAK